MSTIALAWNPMPAGAGWIEVRAYEHTGTAYTKVASTTVVAGPISITGVAAGTHAYVVRAWDGSTESPNSNEVSATVIVVPPAPTGLTITITIS